MFFNRNYLYVIIAILAGYTLIGYVNNPERLLSLIISIPALLIAITFHEFAHAYVAVKLGDDTPKNQGRLNLNPLSHLDPIGCILLLFAGFGWGKPVQINPRNFKRTITMDKGEALVSIAGPLTNFLLAILFSIIYALILRFNGNFLPYTEIGNIIGILLSSIISMNIGLGVFNLLPLPPLDGSKVIRPLLPTKIRSFFIEKEQIFYMIFLGIWITGIASYIISPIISLITKGIMYLIMLIVNI